MAKGIAGTCYLKVDGEQLSVSSNSISIQSAEVKREAVMGSTGLAGYSEEAVAPTISGTFKCYGGFPAEETDEWDGVHCNRGTGDREGLHAF